MRTLCLAAALLCAPAVLAGNPTHPILFVTQVPMPEEVNSRDVTSSYQSAVSPFSNHLADTAHAGRGGSLLVRFSNGQVVDLLAVADWSAVPGGKPAANAVAVRNPAVSWAADKALFSMVPGAPAGPADTSQFLWQLFEITLPTQAQLAANVKPVLTKVANQPPYNNTFPTYALSGRVVFASDRPYNGMAHLTQREEYLGLPTSTGLWSLDPASAASLQLLHHSPSGAFSPMVDSAGRLIFTSWDHLSRDSEAVTDSRTALTGAPYNETFTQTSNGSGNFADESAAAAFTQVTAMQPDSWETFPEPRSFDRKTLIDVYGGLINGNAFNLFFPWMINLDGTGGETLNHVGRHEVAGGVGKSFTNDSSIVDLSPLANPGYGGLGTHTYFNNLQATREDPLNPGSFYGADAADLGTHGAGQIVRLDGAGMAGGAPKNPDAITVTYLTPGVHGPKPGFIPVVKPSINLPATGQTALTAANAETLYRTPLPLADGALVASLAANVTQTDYNTGTVAQPATLFTFRLVSLKASGSTMVPDVTLTPGLNINTSYYVGSTLVSYNGPAWELDPAEVAPRAQPAASTAAIDPIEAGVFAAAGVHVPTFQAWLRSIGAALSVSRDVTKRDQHDRQQPFNLKVSWSGQQTTGTAGKVYSVGWIQFLEADLRRGYTLGNAAPVAGRRVIATPLHTTMSENVATPGAPAGAVRLGDDGSFAAIVPAQKALTWHLLDNDATKTSQVKERFWVTFQKGEIRTCANCHGINTADQASVAARPVNPPQALLALLTQWKAAHPAGTVQHTQTALSAASAPGSVSLPVSRSSGATGPASVAFATADGTAHAGTDYTSSSGTLSWADGDAADKSIAVPLLGSAFSGARTLSVTLSNPTFAALGAAAVATVTVNGPPSVAPVITQQPANASVNAGQTAAFTVVATGTAPLAYQWTKNGSAIAGATSATYTTPATASGDDGATFVVTVTNAAGTAVSSAATLTVVPVNVPVAPTIKQQPISQSVDAGQSASFAVVAAGTAPLNYQWTKNGSAIAGATSATYTTPPAVADDDGAVFKVTVTNATGAATSNAAMLAVHSQVVAPAAQGGCGAAPVEPMALLGLLGLLAARRKRSR
jgi:hypothetical protein